MSAQNPHPRVRPSPGGGFSLHVVVYPMIYQGVIRNTQLGLT